MIKNSRGFQVNLPFNIFLLFILLNGKFAMFCTFWDTQYSSLSHSYTKFILKDLLLLDNFFFFNKKPICCFVFNCVEKCLNI